MLDICIYYNIHKWPKKPSIYYSKTDTRQMEPGSTGVLEMTRGRYKYNIYTLLISQGSQGEKKGEKKVQKEKIANFVTHQAPAIKPALLLGVP